MGLLLQLDVRGEAAGGGTDLAQVFHVAYLPAVDEEGHGCLSGSARHSHCALQAPQVLPENRWEVLVCLAEGPGAAQEGSAHRDLAERFHVCRRHVLARTHEMVSVVDLELVPGLTCLELMCLSY